MKEKTENWNELELKVQNMFSSNLGLRTDGIDIECVQRLGQREAGGKPRRVEVSLLCLKDKQQILSSARKLKGTRIFINEDFFGAVLQRRKELRPKVKATRERGESAVLRYNKMVIPPRPQQQRDT